MRSLETEITIDAPPDRVWNVLVDFDSYPDWNPFIRALEGPVEEGETFDVTMQPPGGKAMTFKPTCLVFEKNREFRWLGHLLIKGLFDGEHIFELHDLGDDLGDGRTKLVHREKFSGILVPFLWNTLDSRTRHGFVEMNERLKERAERATIQ